MDLHLLSWQALQLPALVPAVQNLEGSALIIFFLILASIYFFPWRIALVG